MTNESQRVSAGRLGASGFCYRAADLMFLTCMTGKCCFFGEIQIAEGL